MVLMEQVNEMLLFFEKHPAMLFGTTGSAEGRSLSKKYWVDCAEILNSVSPDCPTKTPAEWRMYYNEFKSKTLKKIRARRSLPAGKRGRPNMLNSYQIRLYNLLGNHPYQAKLLKLQTKLTQHEKIDNSLDESNSENQLPAQEKNEQSYSVGENTITVTFEDDSGDESMKKESTWTEYDETNTRDSVILEEDSVGFHTEPPLESYNGSGKEDAGTRVEERSVERAEELHKLQVAERIWAVKTMRERHATARLERELMQLRRDRADLELQRARRHQDDDDQ